MDPPPDTGARQAAEEPGHEAPRGLTTTVLRGAGVAGVGYALSQVLTLGFYLALARLATPDDFGQFAAGSILVGIGLLFTESGMLAALIHRRERVEEAAATAVLATFAAGVALALVALAASPLIGRFFDSGTVTSVAAAMSGILFLRSLPIVPEALLQRRFSFIRRLAVEPGAVVAFGTTAVIATANGMGVWGLVLGQYAAATADVVLSWSLAGWRPRFALASFAMWRELIRYGRFVLAANAVLRIGSQVPVALIGKFVGASPLGQYRYAQRMASTPFAMILAAASYVLFPAFARIATDRPRFQVGFVRSLRWMAAIAMPMGLILLPLGRPLAALVFGDTWRQAGEAAMALCVFPAASAISSVVSEALKAEGSPQATTKLDIVGTVLAVVAMLALLPLGLVGIAAGISIGYAGGAVYALRLARRVIGVTTRSMFEVVWPPVAAAVLMAGALLVLESALVHAASHGTALGLLLVLVEGLVGVLLYVGLLHRFAPGSAREVLRLVRVARRREEAPKRQPGLGNEPQATSLPAPGP